MRIQAHGATLVQTDPMEGYDEALREGHRIAESEPDRYFHCDQYANDNNWLSHYHTTSSEILAQTDGKLTHFVGGIGTGGTITGVGRRLKKDVPGVEIVQIVPEVFPGIEGLKPWKISATLFPKFWIRRSSTKKSGYPAGMPRRCVPCWQSSGYLPDDTSGAYLQGVYETAKRIKKGIIVTLLNDIGERYMSTGLWT